jgi:hypothetical protein
MLVVLSVLKSGVMCPVAGFQHKEDTAVIEFREFEE